MSAYYIRPTVAQPSVNYRENLSYKISEESWNRAGNLFLHLHSDIPRTVRRSSGNPHRLEHGGVFSLAHSTPPGSREVYFLSTWPDDIEAEKLKIKIELTLKKGSVEMARFRSKEELIIYKDPQFISPIGNDGYARNTLFIFNINPGVMGVYDGNREFSMDVQISIILKDIESKSDIFGNVPAPSEFVKDVMKIYNSEETADVKIICEGKVFQCHKTILCSRSNTFKGMLLHYTLENTTREVIIEDSTVEAVEAMLKHIYTGDIPTNLDQEKNLHLLQLADMYRLDMLKSACAENIVTSLNIANCISSFITISSYFQDNPENRFKKLVNMFMKCNAKQLINEQGDKWKELSRDCEGNGELRGG